MKINETKWNEKRLAVENEIRTLKDSIRNGGTRMDSRYNPATRKFEDTPITFGPGMGTYRDYAKLDQLKNEATILYKVRAQARGKQHQLKAVSISPTGEKTVELITAEDERKQIEGFLAEYALQEVEQPAA